ncbi:MAG: hypothetical protein Q9O62_08270, partial [Ardenticatenia bacterium]|nr:hypothetical protein [Ardenticatenia bacterium]
MNSRSLGWSLVAFILLVGLAAGCAQSPTPTPTPKAAAPPPTAPAPPPTAPKAEPITLWFATLFHSGDAQAMERIVNKFNEEHRC